MVRVYNLTIPIALVGASLFALPSAAATRWVSGTLLRAGEDAGRTWSEPLDVTKWSPEAKAIAREHVAALVFVTLRKGIVALMVTWSFGFGLWHFCHQCGGVRDASLRPKLRRWCLVCFLFSFGSLAGVSLGNLFSVFDMPPRFAWARLLAHSLGWLMMWTLGVFVHFPPDRRRRAAVKIGVFMAACLAVYNIWRGMSAIYFESTGRFVRVAIGIATPYLLGLTLFELSFSIGCRSIEESSFETAALFLAVPTSFMVSMAAVLQLGAVDAASGLTIELVSSAIELYVKRCLLSGETVYQRFLRRVRGVPAASAHPSAAGRAPGYLGVVPMEVGEVVAQTSPEDSEESLAKALELRGDLLIVVVLVSNMMEVVAHTLVFVLLVFAKVNANEGRAPPTSHAQVFSLFVAKMVIEIGADIYLSASSRRIQRDVERNVYMWDRLSREGRVAIGFMSAIMASDLLTHQISKLCPYRSADGESVLAVGLCA